MQHFSYLFAGLEGHTGLVGWTWISAGLAVAALALLIYWNAGARTKDKSELLLAIACASVFVSLWIEKGLTLVVTGFIPSPLGRITEYFPTGPEIAITLGVWSGGFIILTMLYKIFVSVRLENSAAEFPPGASLINLKVFS